MTLKCIGKLETSATKSPPIESIAPYPRINAEPNPSTHREW